MDEVRNVLPLKSAYSFGETHGLSKEIAEIRNIVIEWDLSYTSSLRRGYVLELFETKGVLADFIKTHWPIGLTSWGQSRMRFWKKVKNRYEAFLSGKGEEDA